jgi:nucleolar GTP-binding protein
MNLGTLPKSKDLLDIAFRRARKEASQMKRLHAHLKNEKSKSIKRIEVSANYVSGVLKKAGEEFPKMKEMNPFYQELVAETIDLDQTLKALGHFRATKNLAIKLKGKHIGLVKALKKGEGHKAQGIVKQFYGRLGGLVKKLDASIEAYNRAARKLRELPKIKYGMPTAIIAGYPNTGKSTILGRLTSSEPQIASYPFTTQKLQIGYLVQNYLKFQLVDTPGLLDKPLGKRNKIEKKGIAALKHLAKAIVFVVDPTMRCGFPLEKQVGLLEEVKKEFKVPVLVVVNKADIATGEEMGEAIELLGKVMGKGKQALVEGKGIESRLKEEVVKLLK